MINVRSNSLVVQGGKSVEPVKKLAGCIPADYNRDYKIHPKEGVRDSSPVDFRIIGRAGLKAYRLICEDERHGAY